MSVTEIDYEEYANDAAAQAAYVSSDALSEYSSDVNTKLLLHCNGADESTTFTDDGNTGHTPVAGGTAQIDTAYKKLGSASGLIGLNAYVAIPDHADWDLGSGDFTLELWIRMSTVQTCHIFDRYDWGNAKRSWKLTYSTVDNKLHFTVTPDGTDENKVIHSSDALTINSSTWYHIAVVRDTNTLRFFLDGVAKGTSDITGYTIFATDIALKLFNDWNYNTGIIGNVDETRISHTARWSSGFSVAGNLQSYSESTIKTQGSYSLKGIALITDSLSDTLTRTVSPTIDLSDLDSWKFSIYASRTGANIKVGIHDSGGTTTETTYTVQSANTWETVTVDISGVSNANKDVIDSIIITIANADAANTFYIDNMYAETAEGEVGAIFFGTNF